MRRNNLLFGTAVILLGVMICGCSNNAKNNYVAPTEALASDIYVEPIMGISDDFIKGVDVSELISLENSGVKYYNEEGVEQDALKTLADSGVNYVRIRIWNDPYDENGNGYGGGNCDVDNAVTLGKRATDYGMRTLIDFHYSDFWADPTRQLCPKAWEKMSLDDKADAMYEFTYDALVKLVEGGVDVGMVQIGNEINSGLSGEKDNDKVLVLLKAASYAVSDFNKKKDKGIKIVVHYTDPGEYDEIEKILNRLEAGELQYDIFGVSYYPYWHGDYEKVLSSLKNIHNNHGKDVMVVETAYPYTTEDYDGTGNNMSDYEPMKGYAATLQGQAKALRDVCSITNEAGGLGVFYWGGIWIPVGDNYESNKQLWEKYGSGWASSYASKYDPKNVGDLYGGCSWENQALFDSEGHPLPTINTYKYLTYGTICADGIDYIPDCEINSLCGKELNMPKSIEGIHLDRNNNSEIDVEWDSEAIGRIDTSKEGEYDIPGITADGEEVSCHVTIGYVNLISNPGFEEEDRSMWKVSFGEVNPTDYQEKAADAHTGDWAFHYWSVAEMDFNIEQTITDVEPGTYNFSVCSQGGDFNSDAAMEFYVVCGDVVYQEEFMNNGWVNWQTPKLENIKIDYDTVTVGVHIKGNPKSWGTLDDFAMHRVD